MVGISPWTYNVFAFTVCAVALAGFFLVYKWQRDVEESCPIEDKERLDEFERLFHEGEIDAAEYRKIESTFSRKSPDPAPSRASKARGMNDPKPAEIRKPEGPPSLD